MSRWSLAKRSRVSRGWHWLVPAAVIAFVGCQNDRLPSEPEAAPEGQFSASAQAAGVGANDWIVVFKDDTADPPGLARRLVAANGGSVRFTYSHAIKGFAGNLPPQAIEAIQQNPNVAYVERDGVVQTTDVGSWGLDRIDQRDLELDNSYSAEYDGTGVDVYIIDTGIDFSYAEGDQFGSRLDQDHDKDYVDGDDDASDCHGHGTHVSGTVGSVGYGVATNVTLIGVRVLNCQGSGTWSGVIAGVDYVASAAVASQKPSVANMSLGGGFSSSVNDAVNEAVAGGVVFAVSSGNSNTDACNQSPASAASAITVNASTSSDARSSFSNYGTCTDIFAPGSGITSTIMGGGTESWSGTSMASPHVAGGAALILEEYPNSTPAQVWTEMKYRATRDKISNAGPGSANRLLYSGTESGDPCATAPCTPVSVGWISDASVTINKRVGKGTVTVQVVDRTKQPPVPIEAVTVSGSWTVNGTQNFTTSSGDTDANGKAVLSTGGIRFADEFTLCVASLSGSGTEDFSDGECGPFGADLGEGVGGGGGGGGGGDLSFTSFDASTVTKGRNTRADLTWTGGNASVDVYLNRDLIAAGIANSGSYSDNLGKDPKGEFIYQVCNAGPAGCTAEIKLIL